MRVGVDSGGTFTDCIAWDGTALRSAKVRSTPDDPDQAILKGLEAFTATEVIHGSTVATNALLQRTGARTALVTTKGFEDLLELARQNRADLYDWTPAPRRLLVSREDRHGVPERVLHDGSVLEPLTPDSINSLIQKLGNAESVAVCLLHSYANPTHELMVGQALRAAGFAVSLSSEILPEFREYERAATTVLNSYVTPLMKGYLQSLDDGLPQAKLRVFQSNGGSVSAKEASTQPVRTVLSGPAGGLVGAAALARLLGIERFISFDMGGTSTDVSLFDGTLQYTTEGEAGGLPVHVPMLDIKSIGAGGGSIAFSDSGAALQVGPRSAGAVPGPVCYGTGTELTVTDANLLLGRIDAAGFLAGTIELDEDRARHVATQVAKTAGTTVEQLASAIVRAANAKMERAIRSVSVERGHDPRDYAMICFGGAGPLHACDLAEGLGIRTVVTPAQAGVLSALGMLVANCVRDYSKSVLASELDAAYAELETEARRDMQEQGFEAPRLIRTLDMRYKGQSYELNVPVEKRQDFDRYHQQRYGYSHQGRETQSVTARIQAIGETPPEDQPDLSTQSDHPRFASLHVPAGWQAREVTGGHTILERVS